MHCSWYYIYYTSSDTVDMIRKCGIQTLFGRQTKMKKRHAFTLIELLVVIAVIAILLAILMPALRAAKNQAKKTVCSSHVKGLVLSMRMYIDDYEGKTHNTPNNGLWDNAMMRL